MPARVLVVSVRPAFVQTLTGGLRTLSTDVLVVGSLVSAAGAIAESLPFAIVMDLVGIDDNVIEFCEQVRDRDGGLHVPILLCGTGQEVVKTSAEALIAGADEFFRLPVEVRHVVEKLASYLGQTPQAVLEPGSVLDTSRPPPRRATPAAGQEVGPLGVAVPSDVASGPPRSASPTSPTSPTSTLPLPVPLPRVSSSALPAPATLSVPTSSPSSSSPSTPSLGTAAEQSADPSAHRSGPPPEPTTHSGHAPTDDLADAELVWAAEEASRLVARERNRLEELTRHREEAEREVARAIEELRQRQDEERRRIAELEARRRAVEAEVAAALELLQQQVAAEEERLAGVTRARAQAESAPHASDAAGTGHRGFQSGRFDPPRPDASPGSKPPASLEEPEFHIEVATGPSLSPLDAEPPAPLPFVPLEPREGRFAEGELPALLWACHRMRVTGAVDLALHDGRMRTLHLENGEPVLVRSALPADRPEEGLLRAGLITTARYNELRAGPWRSARRTAAALVAEGVLKPEELFAATCGVLTEQVLSLMEHDVGTFHFRDEHAQPGDRARLEHSLEVLVAEGVRRKFDERRLWSVLGGPASLVGPDDRTRRLPPLSLEEKLALARLDGTRSFEDIILETGIAPEVVLRTALIAVSCGAARMIARGMPSDPDERMAQRERSVAIDRTRIMDKLHAARHGDYFSFLGLGPSASSFEVQRAAERIRQRFDPRRYQDPAFGDLAAALEEIVDVSHDAEAVLVDPDLADGYRRNSGGHLPHLVRRRA